MPRFFVKASQIGVRDDGRKTVLIIGDDAAHITKSLRMKEGESVCVCDMARTEYDCTVVSVGEEVLLMVEGEKERVCPRCGAKLVVRTAKKGENVGRQFLGCSAFPNCRYIENID